MRRVEGGLARLTFANRLDTVNGLDARCKRWTATYKFCVNIRWPATNTGFFNQQYSAQGGRSWMGSQVEGRRDASGLMYMRNRYYDPATARFTQEDPIGLAGGLNVYGFAAGDPVTYSDPYGLCLWPPRPGECAKRAERFVRAVWNSINVEISIGAKVQLTIGTPWIGGSGNIFVGPQVSATIPIAAQSTSEIEVESSEVMDAGFGFSGNIGHASGGLECRAADRCRPVGDISGAEIASGSRTLFNDPGISGKVQALLGVGVKLDTNKLMNAVAELTTGTAQ